MFTLEEIVCATSGQLIQGDPRKRIKSITINSKKVAKHSLFIAIKGERFDGHSFLAEAVKGGAVAVIVSRKEACRKIPASIGVILVDNTVTAMGKLAAVYRQQFDIPVIAVTGSAGKTTTKEWIAAVLSARFKVLKSAKSENNHIGVPLTLFQLTHRHSACVVELGTNRFGDIDYLASIVKPTMAVFTNIGESHLQGLNSLAGIFREKSQLCRYLAPGSVVIYNADDPYLSRIPRLFRNLKSVSYGFNSAADYAAEEGEADRKDRLHFRVNRRQIFHLKSPVPAHVYAALAAICCGRLNHIRYNDISRCLNKVQLPPGRQELTKVNGFCLINDTYNANPLSLWQALKTVQVLGKGGKKILVLADMLELGRRSRMLHDNAGRWVAQIRPNVVLTYGKQARWISQRVRCFDRHVLAEHFSSRADLHRRLSRIVGRGDIVLVKGSRGMKMEETVNFLKSRIAG